MNQYAKAITAALVAAYALFQAATGVGSPAGEAVAAGEWVGIVVSATVAGLAVWAVPNAKPPADPPV